MSQEKKKSSQHGGLYEGLARSLSQMCTYPLEVWKTQLQVLGNQKRPLCFRGIFQSSFTSGVVFGGYFTVYNSLEGNPFASTIAAISTSFLKIPIANSMRVMQINYPNYKNFIQSGRKIVKTGGIRGLYTGYTISMLEDVVETNIRNYLYESTKDITKSRSLDIGMVLGALSGSIAAGISTPFDTIRANLAQQSSTTKTTCLITTTQKICQREGGILALYKGVKLRSLSNAMRYALFYLILETMQGGGKK